MKGKYIKPNGEEVEVINFDEINKMVEVKFERGKPQYYHEHEYSTWKQYITLDEAVVDYLEGANTSEVIVEEIEQPVAEEVIEVPIPEEPAIEETMSGIEHNPITEEPKRRKRTPVKKEVKPTPKKKGKK